MNVLSTLVASAAIAVLANASNAQIATPPASPHAQLTQQVGMATVTLDYSRPSMKGREIFGGLISYGQIWRAGANASTKISFDQDVDFAGNAVPAGTYALYLIPNAKQFTVILHKNTQLWGAGGYNADDDLLRVEIPVTRLATPAESFTIDLQNFHRNGAELVIRWADVQVAVPLLIDGDPAILAEIDAKVVNATGPVSASDYFSAAAFYHETGRDLGLAAGWMDNAIAMQPQAFWMVLARAELAYDMGDMERAKQGGERARQLASESPSGDYGYVGRSNLLLKKIAASSNDA
ncbi:MAG: hypothetical protein DHS20C15_04200 [Planctomycetota bacterium]|nr:MAG: hypothetical protein DHS20C15_04200 [Planctomycetota bacterium]